MEVDAHLYKAHPLLEIRLDDFSKMAEKTQICFPIVERKIKLQNVKKYQIASIYEVDAHLYKAHPLLEIWLSDFLKNCQNPRKTVKTPIYFPKIVKKIKSQNNNNINDIR